MRRKIEKPVSIEPIGLGDFLVKKCTMCDRQFATSEKDHPTCSLCNNIVDTQDEREQKLFDKYRYVKS